MLNKFIKSGLILGSICASQAFAFQVDNLVKFSDPGSSSIVYTLTNDSDEDLFVTGNINELKLKDDGSVEQFEYTTENVDQWKVNLSTSKFVLRKGEVKKIVLNTLDMNKEMAEDEVFMVRFSPDKALMKQNQVAIAYGYGVLSVFGTEAETTDEPKAIFTTDGMQLINKTNKALEARVCDSSFNKYECKVVAYLIPGRVKDFPLDESLKKGNIRVVLTSNDGTISYDQVH